MNRKTILISFLLFALFAGIPGSFAHPEYLTSLTEVYGDGSCGTCHVRASGGGARNSYGTLFENQANHEADPAAALTAIGAPPSANPTLTETPLQTPTASTPIATGTPAEPTTPTVTTVTSTVTPATAGFGIGISLIGLIVSALLARRNNK